MEKSRLLNTHPAYLMSLEPKYLHFKFKLLIKGNFIIRNLVSHFCVLHYVSSIQWTNLC